VNAPIRRLAVAAVILMTALIVATTYWQTWAAPGLAARQDNAIRQVAEFTVERGRILAPDGRTVLAENVERRVGGRTYYFRRYPNPDLAPHVVGYSTQGRSRAGIERSLNDFLTGANANLGTVLDTTLDRIRGATIQGNDVVLTLHVPGQRAAQRALGNRCGAVAAIEPATGRVLVLASSPSYDPNVIEEDWERAQRAPGAGCTPPAPLVNRATDGLYAPGSTYKIVTGAAALEDDRYSLSSTFVDPGYCTVYGRRVNNYDTTRPFGRVDFVTAMRYSINSVFCNMGLQLGAIEILQQSRRFGFYSRPPLETPAAERQASGLYRDRELFMPTEPQQADPGRLAFGQERLLVTPLQMAMVAAGIGNGGVVMQPTIVQRILSPDGRTIQRVRREQLGRAVSQRTAADLTRSMVAVVAGGTGTAAQLPGVAVAGKTGTAETGRAGVNTTSFAAFAPASQPRIAIAVFLENQRGTGGTTAAPIARAVMQAVLGAGSNS
jgi:penicillin-binding protein A